MSVRAGLLAILTLGPAYGLQLHAELASRARHRGPVNVGQIYSTLDRLGGQGLIRSSGVTDDGLPLHRLTTAGRTAAAHWLETPDLSGLPEWTDMLDQMLIAASLDRGRALVLVDGFVDWWSGASPAARQRSVAEPHPAPAPDSGAPVRGASASIAAGLRMADAALSAQSAAALDWLAAARAEIEAGDTVRRYSSVKPRRGRRPFPAAG